MATKLNPYLSFKDSARQAMEFYHSIFGGKLNMSTFQEYNMAEDASEGDLIMHAELETPSGLVLMAADTPSHMQYDPGARISLSLSGENEPELRGYYDQLCQGGTATLPLDKAPWGDFFGMVQDKFGVDWMINITGPKA